MKTDWFKAGARIARTGSDEWTEARVIHWVISLGGYPADALQAVKGFREERRLAKLGPRAGKKLGK